MLTSSAQQKRKAADAELEGQDEGTPSNSKALCTEGSPEAPSLFILITLRTSDMEQKAPPRRVGLALPATALASLKHQPLWALQKAALQQLKEEVFGQEDVYLTSKDMAYYGVLCDMGRSLDYFSPAAGTMACLKLHCFAWPLNRPGQMLILVKTLAGTTVPIEICVSNTVADFKRKFQEKEGIPADQQRIIFRGLQWEDERPIGCIEGLQDESTVHLVLRLRGGGIPPPVFADVSNESALEKYEWASSGPDWRVASNGLNVEGVCKNPRCEAYKQMVICCKGFTHFDLSLEHCACPICKEEFKPVTCAFSNCRWAFSGTKLEGGQPVPVESGAWRDAGNCYERFQSNTANQVHWSRLLLITRPARIKIGSFPDGDECSICYDATNNQEAVATPCSSAASSTPHLFHKDCIAAWLAKASTCPLCRTDISSMRASLSADAQQADDAQAADEKDAK